MVASGWHEYKDLSRKTKDMKKKERKETVADKELACSSLPVVLFSSSAVLLCSSAKPVLARPTSWVKYDPELELKGARIRPPQTLPRLPLIMSDGSTRLRYAWAW